ncbi:MAG TPA: hypothetical protein PLT64_03865 [Syntrophales bacterium]|nr:hypothetical protein [Syntrophales bacterium]
MKFSKELTKKGTNKPNSLVVLDYSGTLSLGMCRFANPENLIKALQTSGIANYGIDTPEQFWARIVNPTWREGATGRVGYIRLIIRALGEEKDTRLSRAAEAFVRLYMDASVLDDKWVAVLRWLVEQEGVVTLVATDHYAEATAAIVRELELKGIPAASLSSYHEKGGGCVLVANSSDLGYLKEERDYWLKVRWQINRPFARMVLVDDFGGAEEKGDAYGEKALERREKTVAAIVEAFGFEPKVLTYSPGMDMSAVAAWIKRQVS